jgi:hypothetical protein
MYAKRGDHDCYCGAAERLPLTQSISNIHKLFSSIESVKFGFVSADFNKWKLCVLLSYWTARTWQTGWRGFIGSSSVE